MRHCQWWIMQMLVTRRRMSYYTFCMVVQECCKNDRWQKSMGNGKFDPSHLQNPLTEHHPNVHINNLSIVSAYHICGGVVAQRVERWTSGRGFISYTRGKSCVTTFGKLFTSMCLCQYILVLAKGRWCSAAGKVMQAWQKVRAANSRVDDL